ncbi:MAG: hypothetical protein M1837_005680 [Sclerophora amabilis]|nr:MAG: hypothetical protein M1837_005680 [Sclerophora amabilis]
MRLFHQLLPIFFPALSSLTLALSTTDTDPTHRSTTTISLWPLHASHPSPWLEITYDASTLSTISTTTLLSSPETLVSPPPHAAAAKDNNNNLLRIGISDPSTKKWRGVLTTTDAFLRPNEHASLLSLHLDEQAQGVFHVGYRAWKASPDVSKKGHDEEAKEEEEGVRSSDDDDEKLKLRVEIVKVRRGPSPMLNKPVVLDAQGKVPVKEEEKPFFQR